MSEIILSLLPYAAAVVATIGAFLGVGVTYYNKGKSAAHRQRLEDTLDAVGKAKEAQDAVESDSDMAVRDRARERMRVEQTKR